MWVRFLVCDVLSDDDRIIYCAVVILCPACAYYTGQHDRSTHWCLWHTLCVMCMIMDCWNIWDLVSNIVYARLNWRRNGIVMAAWEWRPRRYADLAWAPRICLSSSLHTQDLDLKIYGRSLGVMTHDPSSNSRYNLEAITASFSKSAIVLVHDQKGYYYHYEFIHTIGWLWRNPHFFFLLQWIWRIWLDCGLPCR